MKHYYIWCIQCMRYGTHDAVRDQYVWGGDWLTAVRVAAERDYREYTNVGHGWLLAWNGDNTSWCYSRDAYSTATERRWRA